MKDLKHAYSMALSNKGTVDASYEIAAAALSARIPGDFVECGVFAGSQIVAMAQALLAAPADVQRGRIIHLFDSFAGIPAATEEDGAEGKMIEGKSVCDRAFVERFLFVQNHLPRNLFEFHEGWFADTVPGALDGRQIAVLRLDGDLYESTKICLQHLYPKLALNGWLIIDDYALPGCRKAVWEIVGGSLAPIYFKRTQ